MEHLRAERNARDEQPRRPLLAWLFGVRFVGSAIAVYVAYVLLVDWARFTEAGALGALLEFLRPGQVDASFTELGLLYVDPAGGGKNFAARITRSCSVLTPIALVTWVALCGTRGGRPRRIIGLIASAVVLVVFDLVRLSLVVLAGARWGSDTMVLAHDWAGTLITLVALVLGILVLWTVASGWTPSRRPRPFPTAGA